MFFANFEKKKKFVTPLKIHRFGQNFTGDTSHGILQGFFDVFCLHVFLSGFLIFDDNFGYLKCSDFNEILHGGTS